MTTQTSMNRHILYLLLMMLLCNSISARPKSENDPKHDSTTGKMKITLLNHKRVMNELFGEPRMDIKTIGILVYDGFFTLDAIGPMSVFSELIGTDVFYIGVEKGMVKSGRTEIRVKKSIHDVKELDILVVPGGSVGTWKMTQDSAVLNWIRMIDSGSQITASVCSGAWILGAAGLLEGRKAVTHWYRAEEMMTRYGATFEQKRYTHDGKYWTSAGVSAGIDMSLALIKEIRGEKYLQGAMLDLEYAPEPPIDAGVPSKSDRDVLDMMIAMYDHGMLPLIQKDNKLIRKHEKKQKSVKPANSCH